MNEPTVTEGWSLQGQIDKLADFILEEVEGEPSQSEGAVDTAIRVIRGLQKEVEELKVQDIVNRNPGIDPDEVREFRKSRS